MAAKQNSMPATAETAQRQLARRSMIGVCVLMTLGSLYGLGVAGPAGLLSPFEWYSIPPMLLTGFVLLGLLAWRGDEWLAGIAPALTLWLALYVVGNIANALFFAQNTDNVLVYLGWLVPLYLFTFIINTRRNGLWLTWLLAGLVTILLIGYGLLRGSPEDPLTGALFSWTVAQLSAVLLVGGVASFRERFAAENAAAAALTEANSRITALAERLTESEARSRRLIELSPDVPLLVDASGRLTEVTPNCRQLWGLDREQLLGRPFASLFAAEQQSAVVEQLHTACQGEAMQADKMQPAAIRHVDGREYPVRWSANWSAAEAQYYIWVQAA